MARLDEFAVPRSPLDPRTPSTPFRTSGTHGVPSVRRPAPTRILVAYYSRTGTTKHVADLLVKALCADTEVIIDHTLRDGVLGYAHSVIDGWRKRSSDIAASMHDPADYDLLLLGSPVWSGAISSPVRAYLARHRALPSIGFFYTHNGDAGHVTNEIIELCGKHPVWTLGVSRADMRQGHQGAVALAAQQLAQRTSAVASGVALQGA